MTTTRTVRRAEWAAWVAWAEWTCNSAVGWRRPPDTLSNGKAPHAGPCLFYGTQFSDGLKSRSAPATRDGVTPAQATDRRA